MWAEPLQSCPTLRQHGLQPARLLRRWESPGNTGVGCHALLQTVLPQGSDLRLSCLLRWFCFFSHQGVHLCSSDHTTTSSNWHFFGQGPWAFKSPLFYTVVSDSFVTPWTVAPAFRSVHGTSQARILEWGCHFLPQGIFLTQGLNPCLISRIILYN